MKYRVPIFLWLQDQSHFRLPMGITFFQDEGNKNITCAWVLIFLGFQDPRSLKLPGESTLFQDEGNENVIWEQVPILL